MDIGLNRPIPHPTTTISRSNGSIDVYLAVKGQKTKTKVNTMEYISTYQLLSATSNYCYYIRVSANSMLCQWSIINFIHIDQVPITSIHILYGYRIVTVRYQNHNLLNRSAPLGVFNVGMDDERCFP